MPTPANGGKETQGEDNNALQVIELRRQLQEKDRAIEALEQEREDDGSITTNGTGNSWRLRRKKSDVSDNSCTILRPDHSLQDRYKLKLRL